jgi:hypothetical protein
MGDRGRVVVDRVGEDLGPQRSLPADLTVAVGLEELGDGTPGRWRVVVALRPLEARDVLVTRDLDPDDVDALVEGLEAARDEARRRAR